MGAIIGLAADQIAGASAVAKFRLGTVGGYDHPTDGYKEYVYGRADGAVTGAGYLCAEETGYDFKMVDTTVSTPGTSGPGTRVAAAQAALADNEYGWFQIYGKGSLRTLASAAKGTRLNTTGTAGAVDDDGTAGSEQIVGLVLYTATGGAAATNTDAMFSYPVISITL